MQWGVYAGENKKKQKNKKRSVKKQPPVLPKGERVTKMSDQNGASAFNDASRYPYSDEGKNGNNARERELPIKEGRQI